MSIFKTSTLIFVFSVFITVYLTLEAVDAYSSCDFRFRSKEDKESYNKRLILNFYHESFTNPQNFEGAFLKYMAADVIQHDPDVGDGREALIVVFKSLFGNSTQSQVDFIANIAADGDFVWVYEKNTFPSRQPNAVVHIYRIHCRLIVELWDVTQEIESTSENAHPYF